VSWSWGGGGSGAAGNFGGTAQTTTCTLSGGESSASCSVTYTATSGSTSNVNRTITATYAGDTKHNAASNANTQLTINALSASTLTVSPASGTFGQTVSPSATLKRNSDNVALSGKTITFKLNGASVGTATTNASGVAALSGVSLAGIAVGTYPGAIVGTFVGDTSANGSTDSDTLTVNPDCTSASVTANPSNVSITYGSDATFTASGVGNPSPSVQWQVSANGGTTWTDLSGKTTTTLTLVNPAVALRAGPDYDLQALSRLMELFTFLVLRPLNDLALWLWRLERRIEFLYRPQFDRWLRPPIFAAFQAWQNARRPPVRLGPAEEDVPADEERNTRAVIDEIALFIRENYPAGGAQRFGNTKTYGVLRAEFEVRGDLPANLRRGLFAEPRSYRAWVRFSGPGPFVPPDLEDYGQCSCAIKVMGVPGPKLMDDERETQDLILVSPASFVTPDIRENAKLQRWVRRKAGLVYFLNPRDPHLFHLVFQTLYSPMHTSPLEVPYYSNVPFLLGEGQAVQYSLRPCSPARGRIPARPGENYLHEAVRRTLDAGAWTFDFMVQVQTDPHRMPIEDATVKWPESVSPYVTVARLRIPRQEFASDAQMAFADALRYNPWHSLPEHRPLGSSNRARRAMYHELATLRQHMNSVAHVEPTGDEMFS